nr:hypothetical protein [Brevibacillus laterosporus]
MSVIIILLILLLLFVPILLKRRHTRSRSTDQYSPSTSTFPFWSQNDSQADCGDTSSNWGSCSDSVSSDSGGGGSD